MGLLSSFCSAHLLNFPVFESSSPLPGSLPWCPYLSKVPFFTSATPLYIYCIIYLAHLYYYYVGPTGKHVTNPAQMTSVCPSRDPYRLVLTKKLVILLERMTQLFSKLSWCFSYQNGPQSPWLPLRALGSSLFSPNPVALPFFTSQTHSCSGLCPEPSYASNSSHFIHVFSHLILIKTLRQVQLLPSSYRWETDLEKLPLSQGLPWQPA